MMRDADSRRRAHLYGIRAEWMAQIYLMVKGYRVLARRYKTKSGEIDLIVMRGDTVAFVEVKARAKIEDAEIAIDRHKIDRIARAARRWTALNSWAMSLHLRGDAVYLAPGRLPRHITSAFTVPVDLYVRQ